MAKYSEKVHKAMHEIKKETLKKRSFGQESNESKISNCHWFIRSPKRGRKDTEKEEINKVNFAYFWSKMWL